MTREEWESKRSQVIRTMQTVGADAFAVTEALFGPKPPEPFPIWGGTGVRLRQPTAARNAVWVKMQDYQRELTATEAREVAAALLTAADWWDAQRPLRCNCNPAMPGEHSDDCQKVTI